MRTWNLGHGDPLSLGLACDARLAKPDYCNDQIWEAHLGGGEPPAIAVTTTYGLRARLMRVLLRFSEGNTTISDPALFGAPPRVHQFYPNYLKISFSPFLGIDVICEYWVPSSSVITGRIFISNNSIVPRSIRLEQAAILSPLGEGKVMTVCQIEANTVLIGQTGGLTPVLFLTGGPEPGEGPYPSLKINLDLLPGNKHLYTWALATLTDSEETYEVARQTTTRSWEAELAHIELENQAAMVEIYTGNPDWDATFALSQKAAYNLILGPEKALPELSFVLARNPNHGFSHRNDGSDAHFLWSGQTALDTYFLCNLFLPGGVKQVKGFLLNFLATQREDGFIDWKPGLIGQRGRLLAQPMLISLAWQIYQSSQDLDFLQTVFGPLQNYLQVWFSSLNDRDGDSFPEWTHPSQRGFDGGALLDCNQAEGPGVDITTIEDPLLGSMLYRECTTLVLMARQLNRLNSIPDLQGIMERLKAGVEGTWNPRKHRYYARDRDTHSSQRGEILLQARGPIQQEPKKTLRSPGRFLIFIQTRTGASPKPTIRITGQTSAGLVDELFSGRSISWSQNRTCLTTQNIFTTFEGIEITGLEARDLITIRTIDYTHDSLARLVPLWAGIPSPKQAEKIVHRVLFDLGSYGLPYGLPSQPGNPRQKFQPIVHIPTNLLIAEGLLAYGFRTEAVQLLTKLMDGISKILKQEGCFREVYPAHEGRASGEANHLHGLAPLGLFLEVLGVRIVSQHKIILRENNPFPWPITVKYRGLKITRQLDQTQVTFPDGQTTIVTGNGPHLVSLN